MPCPVGTGSLAIVQQGSGKPWANIRSLAAIPAAGPRAFGYRISRKLTPLQQKVKGKFSRGDLWRVTLDIDAAQDMSWVVVSDPIPAGARILGEGDGRDSRIATMAEERRARRASPNGKLVVGD